MKISNRIGSHILTVWSTRAGRHPLRVWPDGCRDLIVRVPPSERPSVILTELDAGPYIVQASTGTYFIGVRLVPGALAKWEPAKVADCGNTFPISDLTSSWYHSLLQHPEQAAEYLATAVEQWFRPGQSIVQDFLGELEHSPGQVPRLSMSPRTLRRRIRAATGAPPQFWVSLHRARQAGRDVLLSRRAMVEVALESGYADQAHMTRELRRWFGITPAQLRRNGMSYQRLLTAPDAFTSSNLVV